jgi:hypothetical protein
MLANKKIKQEIKSRRSPPTPGGVAIGSCNIREKYIERINNCAFVEKMLKEYFLFKIAIDAMTAKLNELEVLVQKFESFEQERKVKEAKDEYDLSTQMTMWLEYTIQDKH